MHSAEHQLYVAFTELAASVVTSEVQRGLLAHTSHTAEHITRLDDMYAALEDRPQGPVCEPVQALVTFSRELRAPASSEWPGGVLDVLLIAVAKELHHTGIAKYPMAVTFARVLGYTRQAEALEQSKQEAQDADWTLTLFAEGIQARPPA